VFIQTFIALTAEVMTDILVELLPQQPVLGLQPGVLRLQRFPATRALSSSTF
jgi:hypothetical protein